MAMHLVANIKHLFKKHPRVGSCLVYGSMCVAAEFSQQTLNKLYFDKKPKPYDYAIIGRYAVIGTIINPNILFNWYRWLDRTFTGTAPKIIVKKLLLDQFVLSPVLLVIFYISMSTMEGKKDVLEECRQKFIPTFMTSCGFWIPAQFINFMFVPPIARVAYVGTCSFIWINILCWIKRMKVEPDEKSV